MMYSFRLEFVRDLVKECGTFGNADSEAAHSKKDQAHVAALEWIAKESDCIKAQEIARLALITRGFDFPRWTA